MEQVFTSTPIPLDLLKRTFTEDFEFVIDYPKSKFKGKVLLTYLSNLGINCSLHLPDVDETLALVGDYLKTPTLVSIPELEEIVINILLFRKGDINDLNIDVDVVAKFIDENIESIERWERRINALPLFALSLHPGLKETMIGYPVDEDLTFSGINYVNLIKHRYFPLLVGDVPVEKYTYNATLFNEVVFGGKNLFHYFAIKENPLFLSLLALTEPETGKELALAMDTEIPLLQKLNGELADVSLI